ncbi:DUF726-domain-containing protein [Venustampulla echinocandica]|uniref:DUF726-domain-containing protein n=1 Tax=Venustampulla echinocandica TaxID=2656787 RepID=A0A370TSN1_9HELO|nr:DUF726-domain-containing protein [Venustampulla echinocandica]RDL38498.1 DUF726-domain-containing protein [Venustampulla echinocandica]
MAPTASDPKDLKLVLNQARRRALTTLIGGIVTHMRKQVEYSFEPSSSQDAAPLFVPREASRDRSDSPSYSDADEARQRRLEARLEQSPSTPKLEALKRDALKYFSKWATEIRVEYKKIADSPDDPRSEQRRAEWLAARNPPPPAYTRTASVFKTPGAEGAAVAAETREVQEAKDVSLLQSLYPPVPTRLTTISKEDRICLVSCMVLLLLSLGHYSAHSRTLLCYLTSSLDLPLGALTNEETEIARTLMVASKSLSADAETQKRQAESATSRRWKVGLASVAGAAVIGITGGLAAPVVAGAIGGIMGGVGLGGVASFLGIFAMNGALVGTLFGAFGGKMTGEMIDSYAKEVSDFKFLPVAAEWGEHTTKPESEEEARRLRVTIGVNGWLNTKDDVIKPWRILGKDSEVFALRYEMDALLDLGTSLENMVSSYAWSYVKLEILKRTVLATLWSALWPVYLLKMATSIDNPFSLAKRRSEKAGEVLADALINKAQGERPVTLIGYSLGARVLYSCLRSLAERRAFGLVESVVFIGAPVPSDADNWRAMRSVISGKVFNVYSENDYILAFLYRATSVQFGVAGLQEISTVEGVDNLNLSKEVSGHLRYPELVGKILKRVGIEHVLVEDADIEDDATEIKLVDDEDLIAFDDDDDGDTKTAELGGFRMVDNEVSASTKIPPPPFPEEANTITSPGHQWTNVPVHTESLANTSLSTPHSPPEILPKSSNAHFGTNTIPVTQPEHDDYYSSEDEGGIQMLDNDDSPLQELECEPVPEEPVAQTFSTRATGKVAPEDSKSLGSLREMKGSTSERRDGNAGSGRNVEGSAREGANENQNAETRRSAASMGLY